MSIFKDCDIRGVYGAELTDADAYSIGRGLATMIPAGGTVRVGGDARLSTPALKEALLRAGATVVGEEMSSQPRRQITRSDLFTAQLTGCAGSQERRKKLLHQLDLPEHLSTKALLQVLNQLMSYEEYTKVIQTL